MLKLVLATTNWAWLGNLLKFNHTILEYFKIIAGLKKEKRK